MAKTKKAEVLTLEEKLQQALVPQEEQPYKVPDNWCWVDASMAFNIEYGKGLSSKKLVQEGYPVFGANGQIGYYTEFIYDDIKALMSCRGAYSGTMNLSLPKSFVTSNSLIIDAKLSDISAVFIFYLFMAINKNRLVSGTAQPQVTVQAFKNFPVPFPPLHEQQRIVDRIESLFAKLDEAKNKAQEVVDGFEERKAAILHKAFTGELTSKWRAEHGVTMDSWEEKLLKNVIKTVKDKFDPSKENKIHKYIGLENIEKNNGIVGFEKSDSIKSLKNVFKNGDILYGKLRPYLNKHDIAPFSGVCSTDILVFRADNEVTARYVNYFMSTEEFINYAVSNSKGINLPRVSEKDIVNIYIRIPNVDEQGEIIGKLSSLIVKEQQAKEAAESVLEQIDLIKKSILAKAFRGELGTNNPGEESAVELLKACLQEQ